MISADEIYDSALHTFANEANAVAKLADTVDRESYVKAVRMIAECEGRIITTGCGTSGACAKKVSQVFNCVDRASQFLNPADAPHGDPGSPIALESDLNLILSTGPEACPYQCLSTTSVTAVFALFDAISIGCMLYNGIDKNYFKLVHPAGGVGAMLAAEE